MASTSFENSLAIQNLRYHLGPVESEFVVVHGAHYSLISLIKHDRTESLMVGRER